MKHYACPGKTSLEGPRRLILGKVAIRTAMDMYPIDPFRFRATGKCNICNGDGQDDPRELKLGV